MTMQIKKLKVETERQALLGDCQLLFLEMLYLQYINLLEDLISTMVIFYMINKPNKENFQNKLEKVQYRACLSITGAIQGTSRTKLYDELGLHSLIKRRWCNKLIFFYKIVNGLLPGYLYSYLDFPSQINYSLRSVSASVIKPSLSRTKSFKNTFFPYCTNEWNNLTVEIRNSIHLV